MSRVHIFGLDFTSGEILSHMKHIAIHSEYKAILKPDRLKVVRFLRDSQDEIPNLNLRHFIKCMDLMHYSRTKWRKLFLHCISSE